MTANWIHIVIVHLTVLGTPLLGYLVWKHRKTSTDAVAWKVNFSGLIALAIVTVLAFYTGPDTSDWLKELLVAFPQDHVEDHALWGRIAFVIHVLTGLIGCMGWASILQEEKPARIIPTLLIWLLSLNTLVLLYTAHLGGMIRRMDLM